MKGVPAASADEQLLAKETGQRTKSAGAMRRWIGMRHDETDDRPRRDEIGRETANMTDKRYHPKPPSVDCRPYVFHICGTDGFFGILRADQKPEIGRTAVYGTHDKVAGHRQHHTT